MENIIDIQAHQTPDYPALAAEKIAVELKGSYYRLAVENCKSAESMQIDQPTLFDFVEGA